MDKKKRLWVYSNDVPFLLKRKPIRKFISSKFYILGKFLLNCKYLNKHKMEKLLIKLIFLKLKYIDGQSNLSDIIDYRVHCNHFWEEAADSNPDFIPEPMNKDGLEFLVEDLIPTTDTLHYKLICVECGKKMSLHKYDRIPLPRKCLLENGEVFSFIEWGEYE